MTLQNQTFELIQNEMNRRATLFDNSRNTDVVWATILGEEYGEVCKSVLEKSVIDGRFDYDSQKGSQDLKEELIQVAAVCVSWIMQLKDKT